MHTLKVSGGKAEELLKRAFFLAYNAALSPSGMGFLQAMKLGNKQATESQIWDNVLRRGDYDGFNRVNLDQPIFGQDVYGDYVYGRMMKWGGRVDSADLLSVPALDEKLDVLYHAFATEYPTTRHLLNDAARELGVTFEVIPEQAHS